MFDEQLSIKQIHSPGTLAATLAWGPSVLTWPKNYELKSILNSNFLRCKHRSIALVVGWYETRNNDYLFKRLIMTDFFFTIKSGLISAMITLSVPRSQYWLTLSSEFNGK